MKKLNLQIKGIKGQDGHTPTKEEILEILGPSLKDKTTKKEVEALIKLLLPKDKPEITPKQIKERLLKAGISYKDLKDLPNIPDMIRKITKGFQKDISSKTISLKELDDVNLEGLTITNGKYDLGSGGSSASYDVDFLIADWSLDSTYYILDVVHSLNSNNPSVTVRKSNGIIQVDSTENVDENTIRLKVPSTPDLRFDGTVSVVRVV